MVGWQGKDVFKEGTLHLSCLLNILRVSSLRPYSFCSTLYIILFSLPGPVHFVWWTGRWYCRLFSIHFVLLNLKTLAGGCGFVWCSVDKSGLAGWIFNSGI